VDSNSITDLPYLGSSTGLQILVLGHNRLTEIPNWFFSLTCLTRVNLRDNLITRVSPKIANLVKLTHFHIENNQLRSFPREATQLVSLYLHNNYIEELASTFWRCNYISRRSSKQTSKYPPEAIDADTQPAEFLTVQRDLEDETES